MAPSIARLWLERVTRSWTFRRRLPPSFGGAAIVVTPSAGLKYLYMSMEKIDPPLLRGARDLVRPGDVVWDIGANVGLFTFAAAALTGAGGQVVAFEPDAWLVQLLRRSLALQSPDAGAVTIVPAAVASGIALRPFHVARRARASNALSGHGLSQTGGYREEHTVPVFNLDWLAGQLPTPSVIKCDVEGAEIEVFEGQKRMLGEIRPTLICEVAGESSDALTRILRGQGYNLYDGARPLLGSEALEMACWDTVAIPEERADEYTRSTAQPRRIAR